MTPGNAASILKIQDFERCLKYIPYIFKIKTTYYKLGLPWRGFIYSIQFKFGDKVCMNTPFTQNINVTLQMIRHSFHYQVDTAEWNNVVVNYTFYIMTHEFLFKWQKQKISLQWRNISSRHNDRLLLSIVSVWKQFWQFFCACCFFVRLCDPVAYFICSLDLNHYFI